MGKQKRFHHLQTRWQESDECWREFADALKRQYGEVWYAPRGKQDRERRLSDAEGRACERFIAFLETLSARHWRQGFPCGWLMESLTWEDATTHDRMSVTPPPAYSYTVRDAEGFAGPVGTTLKS